MDRNSLKQFRVDRRLTGRRTWISEKELALELEKLPDVSHKMTRLGEAADRAAAKAGAAANTAAEAASPSPGEPENPQPE